MNDFKSFESLSNSLQKCKRGVMWKDSTAHVVLNGVEEMIRLSDKLTNNTYKPRKAYHFSIESPKHRDIVSIAFVDRVYQRSLNDNVIYPEVTKHFIYDNSACQKNKGTLFARNRLKMFYQKHYRKYGTEGYILQCDIHGYYPTMPHRVADDLFRRYLHDDAYRRAMAILQEQYSGERGFNPGSQIVQIVGIAALNDIDHFIKERLRIKHYLRYMDDFILMHPDKKYLEYCRNEIEKKLNEIGLTFNEKKTKVMRFKDDLLFLGFYYRITNTGKVIMLINPKNVKKERLKLARMAAKYHRGEMTKQKVYECYGSWRNHALQGNSYKLVQRMDAYLKRLMEDPEYGNF